MGEEQVLGPTKLVNMLLGKPVAALLVFLHVKPGNAQYPISNAVAMELIVVLIAVLFFLWLKGRISVDRPGVAQQAMEFVITNPMGVGVKDLTDDIIGHEGDRHVPLVATIGLFILFSNLISLIPGFMSPTAEKTVPLGCAVIVFLYYNVVGLAKHGPLGYAKTFTGPVKALSAPMFGIELISHAARLLSLTVRLWANMMVSELIYVSFLGLTLGLFVSLGKLNPILYVSGIVPIAIPFALILLHIFVAFLQAFVFVILPIVYLSLAVAEEH